MLFAEGVIDACVTVVVDPSNRVVNDALEGRESAISPVAVPVLVFEPLSEQRKNVWFKGML